MFHLFKLLLKLCIVVVLLVVAAIAFVLLTQDSVSSLPEPLLTFRSWFIEFFFDITGIRVGTMV